MAVQSVFVGGHLGLTLKGGKGPGLRVFIRDTKSSPYSCPKDPRFVLSFMTMTVSLVSIFLEEDLTPGLSLCEQDVVFALALEKLLFYSAPCPQRESARSGETRSVLTRDQMPR